MSSTNKRPQLKRDYDGLMHAAAIMYIKDGLSAAKISERLNVSMPTLQKWNKAGRWQELRPNTEILNQHKAAGLYIEKGMSIGDISQQLNLPAQLIAMWIDLYGWNAAKTVSQSQNIASDIVSSFCDHFKRLFKHYSAEIELVQNEYLKSIKPKID